MLLLLKFSNELLLIFRKRASDLMGFSFSFQLCKRCLFCSILCIFIKINNNEKVWFSSFDHSFCTGQDIYGTLHLFYYIFACSLASSLLMAKLVCVRARLSIPHKMVWLYIHLCWTTLGCIVIKKSTHTHTSDCWLSNFEWRFQTVCRVETPFFLFKVFFF